MFDVEVTPSIVNPIPQNSADVIERYTLILSFLSFVFADKFLLSSDTSKQIGPVMLEVIPLYFSMCC